MRHFILLLLLLAISSPTQAGVYGDLEFGDTRDTVTRKLSNSPLVSQTVDQTFIGRTGLNGIYQCKAKLAGLTCHLYFNWDQRGGLNEITLRSEELDIREYEQRLRQAWDEAGSLFSGVYQKPTQQAPYPAKGSFQHGNLMITHVWQREGDESILMGTGIDKDKCFLFIRFANQRIELQKTP